MITLTIFELVLPSSDGSVLARRPDGVLSTSIELAIETFAPAFANLQLLSLAPVATAPGDEQQADEYERDNETHFQRVLLGVPTCFPPLLGYAVKEDRRRQSCRRRLHRPLPCNRDSAALAAGSQPGSGIQVRPTLIPAAARRRIVQYCELDGEAR